MKKLVVSVCFLSSLYGNLAHSSCEDYAPIYGALITTTTPILIPLYITDANFLCWGNDYSRMRSLKAEMTTFLLTGVKSEAVEDFFIEAHKSGATVSDAQIAQNLMVVVTRLESMAL